MRVHRLRLIIALTASSLALAACAGQAAQPAATTAPAAATDAPVIGAPVGAETATTAPAAPIPEDGEPPCPACGTAAPLLEGACSDCGLQLD